MEREQGKRVTPDLLIAIQRVVCAWCGKSLGVQPATEAQAKLISHGICKDCLVHMKAAAELQAEDVEAALEGDAENYFG